ATDAGLFELAAKTRRLRASPLGRALPKLPIFALARRGSTVLAATLGGLYSIDARGDARLVTVADVRTFASAGRDAELFAASFGDGLLRVTRVAGLASASRFSARAVPAAPRAARYLEASGASSRALCIGGRDGLWVGRSPKALRRVDITALRSGDIAAMARVGSALYLGTFDRGLARVRSAAAGLVVEHLTLGSARQSEARINAFAVDRRGALWIGTARGLYYVSPARAAARERWPRIGGPRRFTRADGLPSDAVLALAPLPGGGVLAGTGRGAVRVALAGSGRATTLSTQPIGRKQGLAARAVWSVAAQGTALWLGTARGLYRIDARGSIARLTVASGHLADDWVTAVVVAKDGAVFAGSYNAGVSRLAPSAGAKHGLAATQLGGGWINLAGLRIDGGYLYAATMAGLRRIALAPGASAWQPLHVDIGRDVTASLRAADGRSMWVSTRRGVVRIAR
ncbi:MAG: hypothetical protein KC503_13220, partial [Myxococcales bacterium]|nr:hypothetical protein [Myxococcales bacterium]